MSLLPNELHTLSGAYALDALSAEEAAAFRTHLEACPSCCEEVRELRAAAAQMGASQEVAPPAQLRSRVLDAADRTPQLRPRVPAEKPSGVASLDQARSRRRMPRLLAAAAAVVLVAGAAVGIGQLQNDDPEANLAAGVSQVFEAPDANQAAVETPHGVVRVATSPSQNEMAVDTRDLAPLEGGRVYQLWALVDGEPISVGVLSQDEGGAHMDMPETGTEVAITIEPAGGSTLPTTEPIVRVDPASV